MQNINPTHTRNRRALFYLGIIGFPLFIGGLIALASVILLTQFPAFGDATIPVIILLVILGLAGLAIGGVSIYRGFTLERDNELAFQVGDELRNILDERYTYIRNVSRRRLGYIDAVLIGPPGALVFRIVDYNGLWRNELAEWKTKDKRGRMRNATTNPTRECARDVYSLRQYFAKRQLENVPVYGVVVFHSPHVTLQGASPVVPISETHLLPDILTREGNYLAEEQRIDPQTAREATRALVEG
ncbi:MAG: NERD domain-containing protein [Anaerolineales bacterium]